MKKKRVRDWKAPHRPVAVTKLAAPSLPPRDQAATYSEIVGLFVKRRKELKLSQRDLDHKCGWPDGYTSKLEIPHRSQGRTASLHTNLWVWAKALNLQLFIVDSDTGVPLKPPANINHRS